MACARGRVSHSSAWHCRSTSAAEYAAIEQRLVSARQHLRGVRDMPIDPFGDFLAAVAHLAERDAGRRRARRARLPRRVLEAASDRGPVDREVRAARRSRGGHQRSRRRAGVHRDRARGEPCDQPPRPARIDRSHHGLDCTRPTPGDSRRPPRAPPRRGCGAARARRRHRCSRRQPRDRDEREPHASPDDPANGSHPAPQTSRRVGPLLDHVRQGHARGSCQPHRTRRLPRRDRTHLRGDRGVRRRAVRRARRLPRRSGSGHRRRRPSISRATSALRSRRARGPESQSLPSWSKR